ncbi:hypothetical protein BDB00DRAFT_870525 [Zychaea mexicana]|uniref:uncharacterized protein n=1 Tax=Zychaea mexicana TaxID=64656 RepID=UPI0022FE55BF|nr:uncharacterized protein BDB00DRAFT_870525 [Zychaea mexicana]KAI9495376.1 hypothetical protein BDB00DRAFT_870525 [Zychaea mexicana]
MQGFYTTLYNEAAQEAAGIIEDWRKTRGEKLSLDLKTAFFSKAKVLHKMAQYNDRMARMYQVPLDKCENNWVTRYFFQMHLGNDDRREKATAKKSDLEAPISNDQATQESHVAISSSSYTPFALPTTTTATNTTTAPTIAITTADISSTSTASPFSIPAPPPSSSLSTQQQQPRTTRKRKSSEYAPSSR